MGSRYGNSPPWFFYVLAAVLMATGLGDRRGEVSPGIAIALGVLMMVGAGFIALFGYASADPFGFR